MIWTWIVLVSSQKFASNLLVFMYFSSCGGIASWSSCSLEGLLCWLFFKHYSSHKNIFSASKYCVFSFFVAVGGNHNVWQSCDDLVRINLYLSFGALLVGGVHEDPSVGDGAVNIWHHGAHITSSVGGAAILQEARGTVYILTRDCGKGLVCPPVEQSSKSWTLMVRDLIQRFNLRFL